MNYSDEHILVVERNVFFSSQQPWCGINPDTALFNTFESLIEEKKQFLPRAAMEINPLYKQIIPYMIFTHDKQFFLMERQAHASEQRLKSKLSLGIGGHIREQDLTDKSLFAWGMREFNEEVSFNGAFTVTPLGIINDDSNAVGEVHIGFAFLIHGDSNAITINSDEHKTGRLVTLDECLERFDQLEAWSQFVVKALSNQ